MAAADPHDWSLWDGQALVVGRGGIGTALLAALPRHCPHLDLWSAGRDPAEERHLPLDLADDASLASFAARAAECLPRLRLVIHTSGLLHDASLQPEKRLSQVRRDWLERSFAINAWGPLLLAQALEGCLPRDQPCRFASLSARVGSIGDNRLGGWYGYRASKAALNQLVRTASIEQARRNRESVVAALHPGTVDSPLSAPFSKSGLQVRSPQEAALQIESVIHALTSEQTGQFVDAQGQVVPW